jgi:hypothetical protein
MLAEHVSDARKMHNNIFEMLRPGGMAFHFFPKLYASPFVINHILPEEASRRLLLYFFPNRRSEIPKFPALYSWCRGSSRRIEERITQCGFSEVSVEPFYGHSYYRKIPILKYFERLATNFYLKHDISIFATFVFVTARK